MKQLTTKQKLEFCARMDEADSEIYQHFKDLADSDILLDPRIRLKALPLNLQTALSCVIKLIANTEDEQTLGLFAWGFIFGHEWAVKYGHLWKQP